MVGSRRHRGGAADWLAVDPRGVVWLFECKTDKKSPYANFRKQRRDDLLDLAAKVGANARLIWRPPRGEIKWIRPAEWPKGE